MSFQFPTAMDSPATPKGKSKSLQSQPSTTPAGPPPSYNPYLTGASTTPAGPPPRSVYGSSFNAGNNTFGRRGNTPGRKGFGFTVPDSSPPRNEADEREDDDDDMEGSPEDFTTGERRGKDTFMSSILSAPRGLKRSRNGQVREQEGADYASMAKGLTDHARPLSLSEADDLVLQQEEIVARIDAAHDRAGVPQGAVELTLLWAKHSDNATKEGHLGPESDDLFTKANYLASLLLQVHHPHTSQQANAARSNVVAARNNSTKTTIPRALLDWLERYHNPFPDDFSTIRSHEPAPSAHERFWDSIYAALTRGKYQQAVHLLRTAHWEHAWTAEEDSQPHGYNDKQLDNIEEVAEQCARLLESCPAVRDGDWDIKSQEWADFRTSVQATVNELETFNGEEVDHDEEPSIGRGNVFSISAASKKAMAKLPMSIYENLRLAYQIILGDPQAITDASQDWLEATLYMTIWWDGSDGTADLTSPRKSLVVGSRQKPREVDIAPGFAYRARLAEAFVFAVAGQEDPVFHPDTLDLVHVGLGCILSGSEEGVVGILKTLSEVVVVGVVELGSIAGWLSEGVARPRSRGWVGEEDGLSSEDLMVLSHGPGSQRGNTTHSSGVNRDDILTCYATLLAERDVFRSSDGRTEREGWELAVPVLGRLDDEVAGQQKLTEILEQLDLSNETRVDKILSACQSLELEDQSRTIAERYADSLATLPEHDPTNPPYGPALIYYARAHATAKLKDTLGLLTSLCLLHSASIPAQADLDDRLASLLNAASDSNDRTALVALARNDPAAATLLAGSLSGYATLRRFYDLRDGTTKDKLQPLARARTAASALLAILGSAADCIHGGLFDPEIESVVPVDGVLVLLGEALPLINQIKRIFTREQVFTLLRIVEDFETCGGRVRGNAESLLRASLNAYRAHGKGKGSVSMPGGHDLRKSKSARPNTMMASTGGLGGSEWDLLAESVMIGSSGGNGKAVGQVDRGWDWRRGMEKLGGVEIGSREVIMLVRAALAGEVAAGWGGRWV
ncbi:hypothetical protein LTR62_003111 [Meristemomyces frigidus]|uniref:Nuclear pore complex protein Nup85 n=1 Tax=Meristemomyces frigidus TaxID=1508187 RepID=A0AAN7TJX7_9PEZI|nr:hypothetical protein LTR62_003111 [Meristemomyces frigidus]